VLEAFDPGSGCSTSPILGSAARNLLVEAHKSARNRDVALRLIAATRAVLRPLQVMA